MSAELLKTNVLMKRVFKLLEKLTEDEEEVEDEEENEEEVGDEEEMEDDDSNQETNTPTVKKETTDTPVAKKETIDTPVAKKETTNEVNNSNVAEAQVLKHEIKYDTLIVLPKHSAQKNADSGIEDPNDAVVNSPRTMIYDKPYIQDVYTPAFPKFDELLLGSKVVYPNQNQTEKPKVQQSVPVQSVPVQSVPVQSVLNKCNATGCKKDAVSSNNANKSSPAKSTQVKKTKEEELAEENEKMRKELKRVQDINKQNEITIMQQRATKEINAYCNK